MGSNTDALVTLFHTRPCPTYYPTETTTSKMFGSHGYWIMVLRTQTTIPLRGSESWALQAK